MASRGYLSYGNLSWDFMTLKLPDHYSWWPSLVTSPLTSAGLDGTLMVNQQRIWKPFRLIFKSSYTSLTNANNAAENLLGVEGKFGDLGITLFGNTRKWRNIHIRRTSARPRPDTGGGPYAVSGQQAIMVASCIVIPTEQALGWESS